MTKDKLEDIIKDIKKDIVLVEKELTDEFNSYDCDCRKVDKMSKKKYEIERKVAVNKYFKAIEPLKKLLIKLNKKLDKIDTCQDD